MATVLASRLLSKGEWQFGISASWKPWTNCTVFNLLIKRSLPVKCLVVSLIFGQFTDAYM